jgi:cob(I)alamin adenosyltransferase
MTIYTGRGDAGETDLRTMDRVSKANPRIEAYGTVDEVNALVGAVRPTGHDDVDDQLATIQNHLHVAQADLSNPEPDADDPTVESAHVETLESWMDAHDEDLEPLTSFILPGGSPAGASLHHARAVCRRAERRSVTLASEAEINETVVAYLNRLSDALFTLARVVNQREDVPEESPTY